MAGKRTGYRIQASGESYFRGSPIPDRHSGVHSSSQEARAQKALSPSRALIRSRRSMTDHFLNLKGWSPRIAGYLENCRSAIGNEKSASIPVSCPDSAYSGIVAAGITSTGRLQADVDCFRMAGSFWHRVGSGTSALLYPSRAIMNSGDDPGTPDDGRGHDAGCGRLARCAR